ncbi:MAG TPA: CYTH and CHAD domain-containing protein [Kineosporiaceae bacterium]|nr:CYTH and CHAD domain-containing protein [Kineosporiaceae bacterium]
MPSAPSDTHHEIEIKLDAGADFVLPDLAGLPGVSTVADSEVLELDAVYLDSEDLRLARHGTTFRRRTGGPDAGWHLKLPAAKQGRIEVRRGLGRSERAVPPQLLGLVRVQLRGEPVAPVARITTRRTVRRLLGVDGVVLAEVADDQVTAEALGEELTTSTWREIEVELVEGDDALLQAASAALVEAGARPAGSASKLQRALVHRLPALQLPNLAAAAEQARTRAKHPAKKKPGKKGTTPAADLPTAGSVVLDYLTVQVQTLIAEDPRVRISAEDGVHQMRVATRRLRTTLATFRPFFVDRAGEPLRAELKWLSGLLGAARDAEVMRATLKSDLAAQPPELVMGPVKRRIDLELGQTYRDAHKQVVTALDSDRYLSLVTALENFIAEPPLSPMAAGSIAELRSRVRHACRRVQQEYARLDADPDPTQQDQHLHDVRIAAKRARYAAEAVRPVIGKPAKAVAAAMQEIQEALGDHHDAVVERSWLRDLGARAFLAGENGFTFGRLHGLAENRAEHDQERFAGVWKATQPVLARWPG